MKSESSEPGLPDILTGFAVAGAISAFTVTPLLDFAEPVMLGGFGVVLAAAFGFDWWGSRFEIKQSILNVTGVLQTVGLVGVVVTMSIGAFDAHANDRRCLAIQRDMLSAKPRRADGPDLFQALGCRPQGEGSVYAPGKRIGKDDPR